MKKYLSILLMLFVCDTIVAQSNSSLIIGNVAASHVNIQEINTLVGTSSDKNGDFQLEVFSENVALQFSCIGYADTIISLNTNDFTNGKAYLNFEMRKINYDLPAAEITASKYFYKSKTGTTVVDISFINDKILILENRKSKSELKIVDNDGNNISKTKFDSIYNEIFVDFFNNYILVGENSCQQIRFDEDFYVEKVANFSRKDFEEKLRIGVRKFGKSFIFKDKPLITNNIYVHRDHNKSMAYFYINPNDSIVERRQIYRFIDEEGYKAAASLYAEIISLYHAFTDENEDLIRLGFWDGNIMRLLPEPCGPYSSEDPCGWKTRCFVKINQYLKLDAKPLNISVFDKDNILYFIYLDEMKILSFDKNFDFLNEKSIEIGSNGKYFKNKVIEDKTSGKVYGIFVKDGIYYSALLDFENASFENLVKSSNYIYPNVFKINNNCSYCAHFNAEKQFSFIERIEL